MRTTMALLAGLLAASPAAAQSRRAAAKDKVTTVKGSTLEGKIQKDTWQEVIISVGSSRQTVRAEDVESLEYGDTPSAFKGAMMAIRSEKWADANNGLTSAEEVAQSKERNVVKPGKWFPSYLAYYRGLCQMNLGKTDAALKHFQTVLKDNPDFRMIEDVYGSVLRIYREKGDEKGMQAFAAQIDKAPIRLQSGLKQRLKREQAELLFDKNKYAEAKKLFEEISRSPDPEISTGGIIGVINCYRKLKDDAGLLRYCQNMAKSSQQPAVKLIATNALGDAHFKKKELEKARDLFIESVVLHDPGRSSPAISREHERAIWRLGECYEGLLEKAKGDKAKTALLRMAASTFRELADTYPSSGRRQDAEAKAAQYQGRLLKKGGK